MNNKKITPDFLINAVKIYGYSINVESAKLLAEIFNFGEEKDYYKGDLEFSIYGDIDEKTVLSSMNIEDGEKGLKLLDFSFLEDFTPYDFKPLNWLFQIAGRMFVTNNVNGDYWLLDLTTGGEYLDYYNHEEGSIIGKGNKGIHISTMHQLISSGETFEKSVRPYISSSGNSNEMFEVAKLVGENIADSMSEGEIYEIENEANLAKKYPHIFLFMYKCLKEKTKFKSTFENTKIAPEFKNFYESVISKIA